jgi:hypothetical protein
MKLPLSNHLVRSSNASGHYSNRLRLVVVRWQQRENDNGERKRQSDNDERRTKSVRKRQKNVPAGKPSWMGLLKQPEKSQNDAKEHGFGRLRERFTNPTCVNERHS